MKKVKSKKLKFKKMTGERAHALFDKIDIEGGNEYFWNSYTSPESAVEDYNIPESLYRAAEAFVYATKKLTEELGKIRDKFPSEDPYDYYDDEDGDEDGDDDCF